MYRICQTLLNKSVKFVKICQLVNNINARFTHCNVFEIKRSGMIVKIIPALKNNYEYILIDPSTNIALPIDPAEPEPVLKIIKDENLKVDTILLTHHHEDHVAGNTQIKKETGICKFIGGDERIPELSCNLEHYDVLEFGTLRILCLFTPGHTKGHFCFFVESTRTSERVLFAGDSLLQGGAGPFSEGTPEENYYTLCQVLFGLPDDTLTFGGHELTVKNLEFASCIEPDNCLITKRLEWAKRAIESCKPCEPSTMSAEKQWNPFLRVHEKTVQKWAGTQDVFKIMEKLNAGLYPK